MFMVVVDDGLDVVIVMCRSSASSVMVASTGRIAPLQHRCFVVPLIGESTQLGTRAVTLAHSSPSATTWLCISAANFLEAARESEQCSCTVDIARHRCGGESRCGWNWHLTNGKFEPIKIVVRETAEQ